MEGSMPAEPWVGVEEVARHLGVSTDTVCRWVESKSLPAHKLGRLWKFKLSDVDEWVRSGGASGRAQGERPGEAE